MDVYFELKEKYKIGSNEKYDMDDLLRIMEMLRSPGGCPWDREQDHQSIKKNFIEETYEVVEAINKDDKALLCEELGDVLLQIVFHSRMEEERGSFGFPDVADGICKKLIERHPHVFGSVNVSGSAEVLSNWDDIKRKSKKQETVSQAIDAVPRELPALMRSEKIQKKAAKAGFDWPDVNGAMDKLKEETEELLEAIEHGDAESIGDELGDLLFSAVNVSRFVGVDAEDALTRAADKFSKRFALVERMALERGTLMSPGNIDELESLWDIAKERLE